VAELLETGAELVGRHAADFGDPYWIAEPEDIIALNLRQFDAARRDQRELSVHCEVYPSRGATLVSVIAADDPVLFYRIAGCSQRAGANISDARVHTTRAGWAVDNFLVQDPHGQPFHETAQLDRIETAIGDALANRIELVPRLARRPLPHSRAKAFDVRPRVIVDNKASNRFTVVEVNARD